MKNVSYTLCRETLNKHFVFNISYENRAVYEIMWKNRVESGRSQMRGFTQKKEYTFRTERKFDIKNKYMLCDTQQRCNGETPLFPIPLEI